MALEGVEGRPVAEGDAAAATARGSAGRKAEMRSGFGTGRAEGAGFAAV